MVSKNHRNKNEQFENTEDKLDLKDSITSIIFVLKLVGIWLIGPEIKYFLIYRFVVVLSGFLYIAGQCGFFLKAMKTTAFIEYGTDLAVPMARRQGGGACGSRFKGGRLLVKKFFP